MKSLSNWLFDVICAASLVVGLSLSVAHSANVIGAEHAPMANKAERKYRCTKCGGVFTFDRPGNHKCPTCNKPLIPVH